MRTIRKLSPASVSVFALGLLILNLGCNSGTPVVQETSAVGVTSIPASPTDVLTVESVLPEDETAGEPIKPASDEAGQAEPTTSGAGLKLPIGIPVEIWQGVPIMPDAITGDENEGTYTFTTASNETEIRAFYDEMLTDLGWVPFAEGAGETGLILFYQLGEQVVSFLIITDVIDGIQMVLVVER